MTLRQYIVHLKAIDQSLQDQVRKEAQDLAKALKKTAQKNLTGHISTKALRRMGHPYARDRMDRRKQRPLKSLRLRSFVSSTRKGTLPVLPINYQSGRLYNSLRVDVKAISKGYSVRLYFIPTKSLVVLSTGGTKVMVARKFWDSINRVYLSRKSRIIRSALVTVRKS